MFEPSSRFLLRLPADLKARGEVYAARVGISLNALLAVALDDYLNAREASAAHLDDGEALVLPPTPSPARKRSAASRPEVKEVSSLASASRSASRPSVAAPKVGRNDPCPCKSGKKFKHCCGGPNAR